MPSAMAPLETTTNDALLRRRDGRREARRRRRASAASVREPILTTTRRALRDGGAGVERISRGPARELVERGVEAAQSRSGTPAATPRTPSTSAVTGVALVVDDGAARSTGAALDGERPTRARRRWRGARGAPPRRRCAPRARCARSSR